MDLDRGISVQLGHSWSCGIMSRLANILGSKEELRRQIDDLDRCGVVECQALYAGQSDVFGDFDTQTLEANDEHVGSAHAFHGLVAEDIKLSTVEGFIDLGLTDNGIV